MKYLEGINLIRPEHKRYGLALWINNEESDLISINLKYGGEGGKFSPYVSAPKLKLSLQYIF